MYLFICYYLSTREHHELTREIDSATSATVAATIQADIDRLEARMSTKAEQIAKLSAYQSKVLSMYSDYVIIILLSVYQSKVLSMYSDYVIINTTVCLPEQGTVCVIRLCYNKYYNMSIRARYCLCTQTIL